MVEGASEKDEIAGFFGKISECASKLEGIAFYCAASFGLLPSGYVRGLPTLLGMGYKKLLGGGSG